MRETKCREHICLFPNQGIHLRVVFCIEPPTLVCSVGDFCVSHSVGKMASLTSRVMGWSASVTWIWFGDCVLGKERLSLSLALPLFVPPRLTQSLYPRPPLPSLLPPFDSSSLVHCTAVSNKGLFTYYFYLSVCSCSRPVVLFWKLISWTVSGRYNHFLQ